MVNAVSLERNKEVDDSAMPPKRPEEKPTEIHDLSRALGEALAGIDWIIRIQTEDREASAQYRTDVRHQIGEIAETVQGLLRDVTAMKPEVEIARQTRLQTEANDQRRDRHLKTAGALVALAVGLATFGRQVLDWFLALLPHK